jgi:predicted nucleic acid-binding protein
MAKRKIILLDSDVISHFMSTAKIDLLPKILSPHHLFIVEDVYRESIHHPLFEDRKQELDNWISRHKIQRIAFPWNNDNIKLEFYRIKKESPQLGAGERACLAIARYDKDVIASSNFRDVADYCKEFDIEHIGVMDILTIAVRRGIFSNDDCNMFIHDAITINDGKFPVDKFENYNPTRNLDEFCTI